MTILLRMKVNLFYKIDNAKSSIYLYIEWDMKTANFQGGSCKTKVWEPPTQAIKYMETCFKKCSIE